MNLEGARELLAMVRALDRRDVDLTLIELWQSILEPFTLDECLWALKDHARNSTEYLRPAHLVEIIRRKRREHADANPARGASNQDDWLTFERLVDAAITRNRGRGFGNLYAVDAADRMGGAS